MEILLLPTFGMASQNSWMVVVFPIQIFWMVVVFPIQIFWTVVVFPIQIFWHLCYDKFFVCFIAPILNFGQECYYCEI